MLVLLLENASNVPLNSKKLFLLCRQICYNILSLTSCPKSYGKLGLVSLDSFYYERFLILRAFGVGFNKHKKVKNLPKLYDTTMLRP